MKLQILGGSGHVTMTSDDSTLAQIEEKFWQVVNSYEEAGSSAPVFTRATGSTDVIQTPRPVYFDPSAEEIIIAIPVSGG